MTLALCTRIPHRYLVIILSFIIMMVTVGYRACFALMATHISFFNSTDNNSTSSGRDSIFPSCTTAGTSRSKVVDWSGSTVSLFHTAYFAGQLVMSIPAGALAMKTSPKRLFGLTLLATSVLQLVLPIATDVHVSLTFVIRTVQGMLEAASVPAMNAVISSWAPKNEKARLINFAYSGVYLSPAIAMFTAGATECYVSWDSIMYIYGSIGAAWCIMWIMVIASSPATHPRILEEEESLLKRSGVSTTTKANSNQPVPWCKFFTSMPVIAIWVAAFCRNFIFALLITEVQQYYKDVYDLPASMNGLLSGVPQIFMVVFMLAGACVFDMLVKRGILSVTNTRKLAQCSGFGIQGLCTLAIGFVDNHIQAFVLLSVGVAFSGFAISGYQTNPLDLAPQFAGPLTGISRTGMLGSVISTTLASVMTGHSHSLIDWQRLFIIAGCIHLAGVIFYGIFASGNLQSWASDSKTIINNGTNYGAASVNGIISNADGTDYDSQYDETKEHKDSELYNSVTLPATIDVNASYLVQESKTNARNSFNNSKHQGKGSNKISSYDDIY
ncbi:unnamed protein product [Candidula unifasciata]|uniref:Major facilitator superfamily (MFS) profile domain-containing protein n=1 Tax=Candidula unifasciata TaxID=100452 RepID=A0A8S3YDP2_9EUPU|nr:unnamed protein product [Candidula unifasciata]